MPALITHPLSPKCVAHIIRPAEGGMLAQVNSLIEGMPSVRALAAASVAVLRRIGGVAAPDRRVLPAALPAMAMLQSGALCGRWARSQGAELLHGHGLRWTPLFAAAELSSRCPLVITLHNLVPTRLSTVARFLMRIGLRRARRIIAVSQAIQSGAAALLGPQMAGRIRVVRNGIDFAPYDAARASGRGAARRKLELPETAMVALCVARLSPEKNVSAFVDAAQKVLESGNVPGACFLIAGDGPEREAIAARIAQAPLLHGRVTLLGARDDVPLLMQAADVVCVPSREEGLGLVAIEAMASGRPVIASRVGGLTEVVVDRETGLLVAPDNTSEMAAALTRLFTDPADRARLAAAGRLRALSLFSAERMLAETRAVYAEALGS